MTILAALALLALIGISGSWPTIKWELQHGLGHLLATLLLWAFIIVVGLAVIVIAVHYL